eukprot:Platyproteum_vivax@DN4931_c0_g1_i3.p1
MASIPTAQIPIEKTISWCFNSQHSFLFLQVLYQRLPQFVFAQQVCVSHDPNTETGACESHIEPSAVRQKTNRRLFFVGAAQQASGSSLLNTEEAAFVVHMIETLHKCFPSVNWTRKIAVISPYLEQVRLLRR